jgi:hypothetical protein
LRGNSPRLYRNTLVFLAADKTRLQDLDEAIRRYLAWASILEDKELLDISPHQVKQAETQKAAADGAVTARLPETYQWLLVPSQSSPQSSVDWQAIRLSGQDALAVRAGKKLKSDELLIVALAGTRLRMELDRIPLWRGDSVSVRQLCEDFAKYLYLPRLTDSSVLHRAIEDGLGLLTWEMDTFAYADSFDEKTDRFRGLRYARHMSIGDSDQGLLVKPDVAVRQIESDKATTEPVTNGTGTVSNGGKAAPFVPGGTKTGEVARQLPVRFYGSVELDSTRLGRDAGKIAEEVVQHLSSLVGSKVELTLEIKAEVPDGVPDNVVRTVTENCRTLKFKTHGFEEK